MSKDNRTEGLKLMAKARQQRENQKIAALTGKEKVNEFDPHSYIRFWGVSEQNRHPFPTDSPLELARIAASLLPQCGWNETKASELAANLIRAATVQIEREKSKDEQNLGMLADNEANRRMWLNLGKRIEALYSKGTLKGKPFHRGDWNSLGVESALYPFPISMIELSTLAGLEESTGRKRINEYVKVAVRELQEFHNDHAKLKGEAPPGAMTKAEEKGQFEAWKTSFKERGIFQPVFLNIAERWRELQKVMRECREEI